MPQDEGEPMKAQPNVDGNNVTRRGSKTVIRLNLSVILGAVILLSFSLYNAHALSCSSNGCQGVITELVAYPDGRLSVRLTNDPMVLDELSCKWFTLHEAKATDKGYNNVSAAIHSAYVSGKTIFFRIVNGTCDIQYVWLK